VFYGQLHTSFLHFHYRASFLRFATSLNNVRSFRPSVFQHTIAHPLPIIFACLSACFGCGFVILFAKKKEAKRYAKPLRQRCCPSHFVLSGHPLCKRTRLLPFPTPSASFRHASPSVDKFATSAQLPFLAQGCFN